MIYFDNASTTKTFDFVNECILNELQVDFYNPSSLHTPGFNVRKKLENTREHILKMLNARNFNLVFTGSATEANNLAFFQFKRGKALVGAGEHPSVLEVAKHLKNFGFDVQFIPLDREGVVDFEKFKNLLTSDVSFISIQYVNNETGAINDIKRLSFLAHSFLPHVIFHSDLVQAVGKIDVCLNDLGIDMASISAHKLHGPKGIGAFLYRKSLKPFPHIIGGGQEFAVRSGTEAIHQIIAFDKALEYCLNDRVNAFNRASYIRARLVDGFEKAKLDFSINGNGSPFILSVTFYGVRGETLMHALELKNIIISTGSACSSKKTGNSTLEAMGRNINEILGNVRISFAHEQVTDDEIDKTISAIVECVNKLKG